MEYYATYTILIDGATWGREDYDFEAENDVEAVKIANEYEKEYIEIKHGKVKELLLDSLVDENNNEIDFYGIRENLIMK